MGEKSNYRDLVVWQRAIDLVPEVYQLVKQLPKEETYALGDQLRRAAVSIPANVAEGQARQHHKGRDGEVQAESYSTDIAELNRPQ